MRSEPLGKYGEFKGRIVAIKALQGFQSAASIEIFLVDAIKLWWEKVGKRLGIGSYDVISIGKASFEMAFIAEKILPFKFSGLCLGNKKTRNLSSRWKCLFGNHPLPGNKSVRSTRDICKYLKDSKNRGIIYLISGGGSSMLCQPVHGLTLKREREITKKMVSSDLPIKDINILRKHLSMVKGGGLAKIAKKKASATFVLCDMNPVDWMDVASSPSLPDISTIDDARRIADILSFKNIPLIETPKHGLTLFKKGYATSFLDTDKVVSKFASILHGYGFCPKILKGYSEKTAEEVAGAIVRGALKRMVKPFALVGMGEGRIRCEKRGIGGRCSHLAALVLKRLYHLKNWAFIAYATDGCDGNGKNAGAIVGPWLSNKGLEESIKAFNTGKWMNENNASIKSKRGNNLRDLWVLLKWHH